MSLTISAILPVYNVAEHLAQAIESILSQTRQATEIIIVDDCSTDGSADIINSFSDPRIKMLRTPHNSGSAVARNMAIQAATGDLIAFLDGDDYWLDNHLEVVAGLLDEQSTAVLAFSPTEAFGDESYVWPIRVQTNVAVDCFWDCLPRTIIPQMNVVVRREAILEIGGYREQLRQSQDYDLFMRLAYRQLFVCTSQITSRYRRHDGSITLRNPQNALHCMYLSRHLFGMELAGKVPVEDFQAFQEECLRIWESALEGCVARRNWRLMDFHLSQSRYVPGSDAVLVRWTIRRAGGMFQRMWDVANRSLSITGNSDDSESQRLAA